jgi:hypothetical protein
MLAVIVEQALKERAVAGITRVTRTELSAPPPTTTVQPHRPKPAALPPAVRAAARGAVAAPGFFGGSDHDGGLDPSTGQLLGPKDAHRGGGAGGDDGVEEEVEDEGAQEGGVLTIDKEAEGVDETRLVRSFEIRGDMVSSLVDTRRCNSMHVNVTACLSSHYIGVLLAIAFF